MLKYLLIAAALLLMAFGGQGLYRVSGGVPSAGAASEVLTFSIALGAGLTILLATLWLSRGPAPPHAIPSDDDRAEVMERLHKHTEALRAAAVAPGVADDQVTAQTGTPVARTSLELPVEAPVEVELPAPNGGDVALPPIMLLDVGPDAGLADIETAPPLGTRAQVLEKLHDIVPDLALAADGRGTHAGPAHAVTFDAGPEDMVHTLVVEASGQTGVSLVRWVMESTGWRAFVPKHGAYVEPDALDDLARRGP